MGQPNQMGTGRRGLARRRAGVFALAAALAFSVVACGGGQEDVAASDSPGYREQEWSIDTRPFELARPDKIGASTIPEGVFDQGESGPTIPTTTLPLPTTTTTTLPQPSSDPVCMAYYSWIALNRSHVLDVTPPETYPSRAAETLRTMAVLLNQSGDPALAAATALFAETSGRLAAATTVEQAEAVVLPIVTEADPAVVAAVLPLRRHVEQQCGDLRAAALEW